MWPVPFTHKNVGVVTQAGHTWATLSKVRFEMLFWRGKYSTYVGHARATAYFYQGKQQCLQNCSLTFLLDVVLAWEIRHLRWARAGHIVYLPKKPPKYSNLCYIYFLPVAREMESGTVHTIFAPT